MRSPQRTLSVIALLLTVAISACGATDPSKDVAESPLTEIKVGALPVPDASTAHIARNRGYFRAEGLDVSIAPIQGAGPALESLIGGSFDVIQGNYVTVIQAADAGRKLTVIADNYQAAPGTFVVMVPKNSAIKSMADLKGKTIEVATLRSIGTLTVTVALRQVGLTANDVTFKEFPLPEMKTHLLAGRVDAAWVTEPYSTQIGYSGGTQIGDMTAAGGPLDIFPIAGWIVSSEWAARNPDLAARFQRAIVRAQHDAAGDRNAVEEILPTYTKIDAATAAVIALGTWPVTRDKNRLQRVADTMHEIGYLTKPFNVDQLLTTPTPTSTPKG